MILGTSHSFALGIHVEHSSGFLHIRELERVICCIPFLMEVGILLIFHHLLVLEVYVVCTCSWSEVLGCVESTFFYDSIAR